MSHSPFKPLPNIPSLKAPTLPKLSVEGNDLISLLIQNAINEENLDPSWFEAILLATATFGDYLGSPQILSSLKAGRVIQEKHRAYQNESLKEKSHQSRERLRELKGTKGQSHNTPKETHIEMAMAELIPLPETDAMKLKGIYALTLNSPVVSATGEPSHLFLTVKGHMDRDDYSSSQPCLFLPDVYSFPFYDDEEGQKGDGGIVLYGLESWSLKYGRSLRILGGTFIFRDTSVSVVQDSLVSVLRISVYAYISIFLEQCLLENLQIILKYPEIQQPPSTPPLPSSLLLPSTTEHSPNKSRSSKSSSRLWRYISKKTGGLFIRATDGPENLGSTSSPGFQDGRATPDATPRPSLEINNLLYSSNDASQHQTVKHSRTQQVGGEEDWDRERFGPFTSTIQKIKNGNCVLSTSLGVSFPLPKLIASLAEREERQKPDSHASSTSGSSLSNSISSVAISPAESNAISGPSMLKLTGIEKTGLVSILGWESREARGKGMVGIRGFIRHQGLTVLHSRHVFDGEAKRTCGRPKLVTYRYWSRTSSSDAEADQSMGEVVQQLLSPLIMAEPCDSEGCDVPMGQHGTSWTCAGMRIMGKVDSCEGEFEGKKIRIWRSCAICGAETEHVEMTDGAYLYSFAKFLELLLWSPILFSISLCEHVSSTLFSVNPASISESRLQTLWHFTCGSYKYTLALESITNSLYEIHFPRLQIISSSVLKEEKQLQESRRKRDEDEERQALGAEIQDWWQNFKSRLDKLDAFLVKELEQAASSKDLPPLPLSDDEESEDEDVPEQPSKSESLTKRPQGVRSISTSSQITTGSWSKQSLWHNLRGPKSIALYPPGPTISFRESRQMLAQLKLSFDQTEGSLRKSLLQAPISSLNDVRRTFRSTARGALKRLCAWQVKHAPGAPTNILQDNVLNKEPEWWRDDCHPIPGGRVVVREGESGSIIAFTLSSLDYQRELTNLNAMLGISSSPAMPIAIHTPQHSATSSDMTIKPSTFRHQPLDPDASDSAVWEEDELCLAVVTRKEHPKEVSTLLGFKDVLRTKKSFDTSVFGSRFSSSLSRGTGNPPPPSVWAPALVQVNLEAADGQVSQIPEAADMVGKTLESRYPFHQRPTTPSSQSIDEGSVTPTLSGFVERHIRRGGDSTIIGLDPSQLVGQESGSGQSFVPLVAPKPIASSVAPPNSRHSTPGPQVEGSLTSALSAAVRYLLNGTNPTSRPPSPITASPHHKLLAYEPISSIDEHPHIKYDWTIGQRIKFSCTVYYAKQFDTLRKRCGVDTDVIKSLERSENWTAIGGKSRSNFWKSSDDRFIIKTLVNAWNVADLQVLIDIAPSYFRYLDNTAHKASALAKLMGFYTVEIKNLDSGVTQAKHDLLVMENLFYKHTIAKTYDLKGIQTRRIKPNQEGAEKTLFDGEWMEAQRRSPLFIYAYSGYTLQEALRADADFLAKSNIMDYSLLLGIDEDRHEISCGLVDTIGSYTFAKTLEYKAKHNLNPGKGKEVTVIPPAEYHNRFIGSMESYFLLCPDKWTKPLHFIDRTKPKDLPSIF